MKTSDGGQPYYCQNFQVKVSAGQAIGADAHCSFAQDFDIEMLKAFEKTGDHAFLCSRSNYGLITIY